MRDTGGTIRRWLDFIQQFDFRVTHRSGKYITADLISRATHLSEPPPSDVDSITQGKGDIFPLPWKKVNYIKKLKNQSDKSEKLWSQVNNCSSYTPPSCQGKICTIVQLPWHLATANGIEGRGPPLIGAIKGKIVLDQFDLEKAQNEDGALTMVRSWFNKLQVRLTRKKLTHQKLTVYMETYCNCTR